MHYNRSMSEFRSGNGAIWLDLTATLLGRYREDRIDQLADPAALRAWLGERDLVPREPMTADDLARARELREALHAAARAALRGAPPPTAALRSIEAALEQDRPLRIKRGSTGLRTVAPLTAAEALARIARAAVQDLSGPSQAHLRACGDDTCSGIFVDYTGRRHWCSDERCGNRARVRAHRARAREGKAADK
jgi:predicted RNA-binding Zn ribbon-like protein